MKKETLRMQMLAGIITESQYKEKIEENNVEGIDVSLVKDLMNDPNVKKMTSKLKADPKSLKDVIKFIGDHSNDNSPLNEEAYKDFTTKEKIASMLRSISIPAPLGYLFGFMIDAGSVNSTMAGLVGALTAAVIGLGIGAAATDGFKRALFEDGMSVEDQIQKIVNLGKQM
jgi:hypothetical protein